MDSLGFDGGRGSCLAVTAQSIGPDQRWWTEDDIYEADLNVEPAVVSVDFGIADGVEDPRDRVRPFFSVHPGGAVFGRCDGSTQFVDESVSSEVYYAMGTIQGGEVESF